MKEVDWLLKGEPREVQMEALRRSYPRRGYAHFLEMRLGKSSLLLAEFELFRRDHGFKWLVVLSPNSFKFEWCEEAIRWGSSVPAHAFDSSDKKTASKFVKDNAAQGGILVVNYESLIQAPIRDFVATVLGPQTMIAFDESIKIKNPQSATTKACIALSKECGARRVLTGKPVTQAPSDLWAQLRAIGELDGQNFFSFRNTYCRMGGFQGKKVIGSKNEEQLQATMAPCAFIARRVDWMKTPGREYATRKLEMIHEQRVHYRSMEQDFLVWLGEGTEAITADQIVSKLLKLQQISSGFIIDEYGKPHDITPVTSNPKVQDLKSFLSEEVTGKLFVVVHYSHSLNLLEEALKEFNPAAIRGAAWHSKNERSVQDEKLKFNSDPSCRVLLGQELACKYGHSIIGAPDDPCLNMAYYENSFSLDDRAQTEERPQGAAQQGLLTIWDYVCSPFEKMPILALQRKEDVSAAVLGYARETGLLPHNWENHNET